MPVFEFDEINERVIDIKQCEDEECSTSTPVKPDKLWVEVNIIPGDMSDTSK